MLFTWHGNSNHFQASFIVTAAEMTEGAGFSSPEFTNSLSVGSLSGATYNLKDNQSLILGGVNPWDFDITFVDFGKGMELFVSAVSFPIGSMAGTIEEKPISGADSFYERGFWTFDEIPEPSTAALLTVGIGLWIIRKERGSIKPLSP